MNDLFLLTIVIETKEFAHESEEALIDLVQIVFLLGEGGQELVVE